jgi:hypothetical protein
VFDSVLLRLTGGLLCRLDVMTGERVIAEVGFRSEI